jgi:putative ABC transport system substrate-binding protein
VGQRGKNLGRRAADATISLLLDSRQAERRLRIDPRPHVPHSLAPGSQTVCCLLWLNVSVASTGAVAAARATRTIPIVMVGTGDPVGLGLVQSLARPGGNITGPAALLPEIGSKWVELPREAVPKCSRIAVLWNPANALHERVAIEIEKAARPFAIEVKPFKVAGPADLEASFAGAVKARASAVFIPGDPMFARYRSEMAALALKSHLPSIFAAKPDVEAGALMAYGPSFADIYRNSAVYVDKILRGAKPSDLPVEQPTLFEFVINLKTAKALGLTIPPSLLGRADEVIQ